MVVQLRRRYAALLTSGTQLALLVVGLHLGEPAAWAFIFAAVAALSFAAWIGAYRRWRAIADTPTSQIASAAQGYAELAGRAENRPGIRVLARLSTLPCCWYRYRVQERRSDRKGWTTIEEGESEEPFVLRDETGACVVDPEGAEVLPAAYDTWTRGDRRYTEWLVREGDPLYALGEFATLGGAGAALDRGRDVGALLADWKHDRPQLLARFDLDRDGELSFREWALARAQAKREIDRTHAEERALPGVDCLRRPADGRLFLLSNLDPDKLNRKYYGWAWIHLAVFFGAMIGALVALGID
ncbi:MAG: E3 ubiquitin ligase family protein [Burkholderiales bacterium]|jgi:hypothetical protein|nr:E3 ubiquitin ligase family protein [Burkholderiales bacterium]